MNDWIFNPAQEESFEKLLGMASGRLNQDDVEEWVRRNLRPRGEHEFSLQKQMRSVKSSQKEIDKKFLRLVDRGIEEDKPLLKKLAKA